VCVCRSVSLCDTACWIVWFYSTVAWCVIVYCSVRVAVSCSVFQCQVVCCFTYNFLPNSIFLASVWMWLWFAVTFPVHCTMARVGSEAILKLLKADDRFTLTLWYVHMYICIYAHVNMYIRTHKYVYTHTHIFTFWKWSRQMIGLQLRCGMHIRICIYAHVYMSIRINTYIILKLMLWYAYISMYIRTRKYVFTHT